MKEIMKNVIKDLIENKQGYLNLWYLPIHRYNSYKLQGGIRNLAQNTRNKTNKNEVNIARIDIVKENKKKQYILFIEGI